MAHQKQNKKNRQKIIPKQEKPHFRFRNNPSSLLCKFRHIIESVEFSEKHTRLDKNHIGRAVVLSDHMHLCVKKNRKKTMRHANEWKQKNKIEKRRIRTQKQSGQRKAEKHTKNWKENQKNYISLLR